MPVANETDLEDEKELEILSRFANESFNEVWSEQKHATKSFSKRKVSEYFYRLGMTTMILGFSQVVNDLDEDTRKKVEEAIGKSEEDPQRS